MPVSVKRLQADLERFSRIGRNAQGGIDRSCLSAADVDARHVLGVLVAGLGGRPGLDAAANFTGLFPGAEDLPAIWIGSHLDTVANGGAYDGALGVLAGLEVVRSLQEDGIRLRHPVAVVSFTGEEPNRFGLSTLGSRALTGRLTPAQIEAATDPAGERLVDALRRAGGNPLGLAGLGLPPEGVAAYLELHIEQGLQLAGAGLPVGVVGNVVGIHRTRFRWTGDANHAGTTLMADRRDALTGAAELALYVEHLCRKTTAGDRQVVGTVGQFRIAPNAPNIIPGTADMMVELRSAEPASLDQLSAAVQARAEAIAAGRGLHLESQTILHQAPVQFDPRVTAILQECCLARVGQVRVLTSMGGHDAVHMSGHGPAGMLFVRTPNGKSHCPQEYCDPADMAVALQVLREATTMLDQALHLRVKGEWHA